MCRVLALFALGVLIVLRMRLVFCVRGYLFQGGPGLLTLAPFLGRNQKKGAKGVKRKLRAERKQQQPMGVVSCCSTPRRYPDSNWRGIRQCGTQHSPGMVRDLSAPPYSVYNWEPTFTTRPNCWAIGLQNEQVFKGFQEVRANHLLPATFILTCASYNYL